MNKNLNTQKEKEKNNTNSTQYPIQNFIIGFAAFILILNTSLLCWRAYTSYISEVERELTNAKTISKSIGDHVELTLLAVDVVLKRAIDSNNYNLLFGNSISQHTKNNIINWANQTPQISGMFTTDKNGEITDIYRKDSYKTWMQDQKSVFQEAYFLYHIDEYDDFFMSSKINGDCSYQGNCIIYISRRLDALDGSFAGIIAAAIDMKYIIDFFHSIEKNSSTFLLIDKPDGNIYQPQNKLAPQIKNELKIEFNKYKQNVTNKKAPHASQNTAYFDEMNIFNFYYLDDLNLHISIIFFGNDILKSWYNERISDAIFYVVFILFVILISLFSIELVKKMNKLRFSEKNALNASKAKSEFLANMSHELRTPLNAIIGFSEMLQGEFFGTLNSKQLERINDIHGCGKHLLLLINDILDFSKGSAGKMELIKEDFSLHFLTKEVLRMFDSTFMEKSLHIINLIDEKTPHICADKRKIKQIIINLISNAVKFSDNSDIIEIKAENNLESFDIIIKDTGIGMNEDDVETAISEFSQVHKDSARGGTGLGLPIVNLFSKMHNATLHIKSKVNIGTEVKISFPKTIVLNKNDEL